MASKRIERRDAFLSAQKQLLQTSEYIVELDDLSSKLGESIRQTADQLTNPPALREIKDHPKVPFQTANRRFSTVLFSLQISPFPQPFPTCFTKDKEKQASKTRFQNIVRWILAHLRAQRLVPFPFLSSPFLSVRSRTDITQEKMISGHVDIPFSSAQGDLHLLAENSQRCIHTAVICPSPPGKEHPTITVNSDYQRYLESREILLRNILSRTRAYSQRLRASQENQKSSSSPREAKENEQISNFYSRSLPFSFLSISMVLYGCSQIGNISHVELYKDFIQRIEKQLSETIISSLQRCMPPPHFSKTTAHLIFSQPKDNPLF